MSLVASISIQQPFSIHLSGGYSYSTETIFIVAKRKSKPARSDTEFFESQIRRLVRYLTKDRGFKVVSEESYREGIFVLLSNDSLGLIIQEECRMSELFVFLFDNSAGLTEQPYGKKDITGIWLREVLKCKDDAHRDRIFWSLQFLQTKTAIRDYIKALLDGLALTPDKDLKAALRKKSQLQTVALYF